MHPILSAVAVLRGGELMIANARFHELSGPPDAPYEWRAVDAAGEPSPRGSTLEVLAIAGASGIAGAEGVFYGVFERVGRFQLIEVQAERAARLGGDSVVIVVNDVTDRSSAERELTLMRRALEHQGRMRAIGELASGTAHDLNNVLSSLVLRVSLLRGDELCMRAQADVIDAISRNLKEAAAHVNKLQQRGRRPRDLAMESADLGVLLREAIDAVRPEVEDRALSPAPIRIAANVPALPSIMVSSSSDLRDMFMDLILNAQSAMLSGGTIEIGAEVRKTAVIVTIADEGACIPEDQIARIFDPFFSPSPDRCAGIELSSAYDLMSMLSGKITAANRPSDGVVFTLNFPTNALIGAPPSQPSPKATQGARVLLIDADALRLGMTAALAKLPEPSVEEAGSAAAALSLIQGGARYEIVIFDVGVTAYDGFQLAQAIRDIAPETKVYLVLDSEQEFPTDDPRLSLVSGVLRRPLNLERLSSILRR